MSEKKLTKPHLSIRLNLLFFVVFMLFSALILRLGVVQIVQGESYQEQLESTVNVSQPVEAPRGLIYDRYGNLLVDNELQFTVTYTNRNTSQTEMIETATKLSEFISMSDEVEELGDKFERDRKEFWSILNEEEYLGKLSIKEAEEMDLSDSEAHLQRLDNITEEELSQLTDNDLEVFLIWREFNSGYNNLPHKVDRGIGYEESAKIMEHMDQLPGVDIIRDSARKYMYGNELRGIIGSVGSIPRDEIDIFLSQGYERNEEVGRSYLEAQYESVLKGRKGELENSIDQDGNILSNPEESLGSRGNDLVLTLDLELHQRVQDVIEDEINSSASNFIDDEEAYVVMMDPNTGDVLSMTGLNNDIGTFTSAYVVGSSIKGATVFAGLDSGVMQPGVGIYDRPLQLPGSQDISSVSTLGYVDERTALERSSNIYMTYVAMRLVDYTPGVSGTNWGSYYHGFDTLRSYYQQFGLGVETGIDLPNEFKGINGGYDLPSQLLFLSFGQFDTYTTMQLAQYVSTIANDGVRIAPRVVKEIREPNSDLNEMGALSQQIKPNILNYLDSNPTYLDRIQEGFNRVVNGPKGTARSYFGDVGETVAGKTGTAQVFVEGIEANNQTFVGYAPYDNPEVAISVVVPGTANIDTSGVANRIAEGALGAYFELQEYREGPNAPDNAEEVDEIDNDLSN
ncbi:penicillin-binding protein [Salipaludibacillus neizhouensis]|uniref:serine-type D-Ala-D-Ala carboxypeptidase n=1 Tax=Salipaludibacillus neizhouensis TaxID=885475 RepID=A0A3A9KAU2_9BACI|nr:penicillin-binding transpeptidase domain-containing protein [Salipaludibacillus neizhouensis]RKL68718.1 penicillin-binding protein [Salipaludibacillus neizhouensis]